MTSPLPPGRKVVEGLLVAILIAIGTGRIVATYSTFSNTFDEGVHVACGLEWWSRGTTTADPPNGPLGRIPIGLVPHLRGLEYRDGVDVWTQGTDILLSDNDYQGALASARVGVLPFFWVAALGVWFWGRRLFGEWPALGGLLLFTNLPPILAHAGLATTDMAIAATFVWFVWALVRWLDEPGTRRAVWLGAAFALAFASKFSVLPFGLATVAALVLLRWLLQPADAPPRRSGWTVWLKSAGAFAVVSYLIVWGLYRFSLWSVADFCMEKGWLNLPERPLLRGLLGMVVPGGCFRGIASVINHVRIGHEGYLMGEVFHNGRWWFYPVDLALKTPLGFLALAILGLWTTARDAIRRRDWRILAPGAAAAAILSSILTSSLNLGIRYILPIYPLLAIVAAGAIAVLWSRGVWGRVVAAGLIGWTVAGSVASHPDYLAHFNELAGSRPEYYLVESDLDWGQDALRLRDKLAELGVERFSIAYFGHFDFDRMGFPPHEPLTPGQPTTGWVAVSLTSRSLYPDQFAWLLDHEPVCRVGKTIDLYYIQE